MKKSPSKKRRPHPLLWVVEPLMDEVSYLERPMFGCLAIYLYGRLVLALTEGEEPWNGLLIPTDHQFHESIRQDFHDVIQHPVLKKWLYLSETSEGFESEATEIAERIRMGDPRIGVEPGGKRKKR
ncbi:MAG: hypothetical protein HZB33_14045 [Nitrospirae bacterium]|nr:hypothetical protein [Nitrospirota bacterium]